jgi:hypothetical protein
LEKRQSKQQYTKNASTKYTNKTKFQQENQPKSEQSKYTYQSSQSNITSSSKRKTSRRCSTRYSKRQQLKSNQQQQKIIDFEEQQQFFKEEQAAKTTELKIISKYGYVADPSKTALHNAAVMIATMPIWYYFCRPTNQSCHNLCTHTLPPRNYRALLGLGLKCIPKPRYTNSKQIWHFLDRFKRDMYIKIFLAHTSTEIPRLYIRSEWIPPIRMVNFNLQERANNFTNLLANKFTKKLTRSNMLPHQRRILAEFRTVKQHIVMNADKNLGPCVIERDQYIKRALNDHLLDTDTYKQLTSSQASHRIENLKQKLTNLIEYYKNKINPTDVKYLKQTMEVKDPYAKFYITAKVHKSPWKTRPIISVCGSLLDGLGRLVDKILQPYFRTIPSAIRNSISLKDMLMDLHQTPPTARFFTADAVSMYTNIDTNHALAVIPNFLQQQLNHSTIHEKNIAIEGLQ